MKKRLVGRKNKLKGRMQPVGLTLAMPGIYEQMKISAIKTYGLFMQIKKLFIIFYHGG
jgi:hypothetical protein